MNEDDKLKKFFQTLFETTMERNPIAATYLGYKHEKYDHLLPNGSLRAKEEEITWLIEQKKQLKHEIDYDALTDEGKLDYDLVQHYLDKQFFEMTELATWRSGTDAASGAISYIGSAIYYLYSRDFAPLETRVKAMISRLNTTAKFLEETKSRWLYPVKLWTEMAIDEAPRTISFLQLILQTLKTELDSELYEELEGVVKVASKAFQDYANWITDNVLSKAYHDWSIGAQKYGRLVEVRKIAKTMEEILAIGEKTLIDTKNQLEKLAQELHPGKTLDEVRDFLKSNHNLI
ncbi:MAG: DUF885 family protein [Candidatus Hodarchaeota archaeon]